MASRTNALSATKVSGLSLRTYFAVTLVVALLAACGGDGDDRGDPPAGSPTPAATATEGGDEAGNRVEVQFDVMGSEVTPDRIEVPAFLGLKVRLRNRTGVVRPVTIDGEVVTALPPGGEADVEVEGLQPGDHVLEAEGSGRATIVAVRAGG